MSLLALAPWRSRVFFVFTAAIGVVLAINPLLPPSAAWANSVAPGVTALLSRASLDAPALTAAGVTTTALASLASGAASAGAGIDLPALDGAVGTAKCAHDALQRKVQSGLASAEEVQSLPQLATSLSAALSARSAALDSIFTAATQDLSTSQRETLATIRTNRAAWSLPTAYLVVERSESEWVQLRDALANKRICERTGDEPNPQLQALLGTVRARAEVATARAALESQLRSMQAAWDALQ